MAGFEPYIPFFFLPDEYPTSTTSAPPEPPPVLTGQGIEFNIPFAFDLATLQQGAMINHARTLLGNQAAILLGLNFPGEEYVPETFYPVTLPSPLARIRALLFGSQPDRIMVNYRLRQYMTLLHATELSQYVTAFGARLTYLNRDWLDLFDERFFGVFVAPYPGNIATGVDFGGSSPSSVITNGIGPGATIYSFLTGLGGSVFSITGPSPQLFILGDPEQDETSDRLEREWFVEVVDTATVRIVHRTPPYQEYIENYVLTNNLSDIHALPHSSLKFRFESNLNSKWRIVARWRPSQDLGSIAASLRQLPDQDMAFLFGRGQPKGELQPFRTFRRLWESHYSLAYSLGGLLLALIYRTDELRRGGLLDD